MKYIYTPKNAVATDDNLMRLHVYCCRKRASSCWGIVDSMLSTG